LVTDIGIYSHRTMMKESEYKIRQDSYDIVAIT
jgi:hypothetical protein